MPFQKGNKFGHRFTSTDQPAQPNRGNRIDRIGMFLQSVKVKPLSRDEVAEIDRALISMSRDELIAYCNDSKQPIIVRARAKKLIEKSESFDAVEKLLDRSFGKPTIKTESAIDTDGVSVVFNAGGGKPARTTEETE